MAGALWRQFERVARRDGVRTALLHGDRQASFAELHAGAQMAAATLARHGLGRGQRCLIWAVNSVELALTILAVWRLGGIVVLVNDEAPAAHFGHAAAVTAPVLAVCDPALAGAAAAAAAVPVLTLPLDNGIVVSAGVGVGDHEPASVFFTSGSTGLPKGVTQSHATLLAGCRMVAEHLGLRCDDRILCPIPWSFDYGYGQLLSTLLLGIAQILPAARNPFALCEAIVRHRPTVLAGLPAIFALLLRGVSPLRDTDRSSLRLLTNTGGKLAPAIFDDLRGVFAGAAISLNYGLTETYRSAGLACDLAAVHPASVGRSYPGVALAVVRDDGSECAPGETGEIVHRGTGVFMGYWGAPEATAAVLRPDPLWDHAGIAAPAAVFTGDLGWRDDAGLLYVAGRRDRQVKSMGVRVSPDEIETLIRGSGLVRDVAVVGVPHLIIGDMLAAAVTVADGAADPVPELKAFARRALSPFMQPRAWHVVEAFPLNPNGKTDFAALRLQLSAVAA